MSVETLSVAVDLRFASTGVAIVILGLLRRPEIPIVQPAPEINGPELVLTAAALLAVTIGRILSSLP